MERRDDLDLLRGPSSNAESVVPPSPEVSVTASPHPKVPSVPTDPNLIKLLNDLSVRMNAMDRRAAETQAMVQRANAEHQEPLAELTPEPIRSLPFTPRVSTPRQAEHHARVLPTAVRGTPSASTAYYSTQANVDYSVPGANGHYTPYCPGAEVPGLREQTTMDVRFALVVSYRAYRLLDQREAVTLAEAGTIHKKAKSIRRMTTGTACFDGSKPIKLLSFLKLVKESFDDARIPEGMAVRVLAHLLEGSARSFYYTRSGTGAVPSSAKQFSMFSWPHMVAALLQRYLTEDILHQAGEAVMQARQKPDEDENASAERIEEAARDCTDVYTEHELMSAYIRASRTQPVTLSV